MRTIDALQVILRWQMIDNYMLILRNSHIDVRLMWGNPSLLICCNLRCSLIHKMSWLLRKSWLRRMNVLYVCVWKLMGITKLDYLLSLNYLWRVYLTCHLRIIHKSDMFSLILNVLCYFFQACFIEPFLTILNVSQVWNYLRIQI